MHKEDGHFWLSHLPNHITFENEGHLSLNHIYKTMVNEGILDVFFYDVVPTIYEFVQKMSRDDHWFYVVYNAKEEPLAFSLLNGFTGRAAIMHFCVFDKGKEYRTYIADEFKGFVKASEIMTLVGITPKPYRHAIKYALDVGYTILGEVKGGCTLHRRNGAPCNAVITTLDVQGG